jgi:hypothetical protein
MFSTEAILCLYISEVLDNRGTGSCLLARADGAGDISTRTLIRGALALASWPGLTGQATPMSRQRS